MHEHIAAVAAAIEKHRDLVTGFEVRYHPLPTVILSAGRNHYSFVLDPRMHATEEVEPYLVGPAIQSLRRAVA